MDTQALLGSVAIGPDTSGAFKLSPYGLAVKSPSGRFLARYQGQLVDVTELAIDTSEGSTYRLPVSTVHVGDLIIRADNPLSALFVEDYDDHGSVTGTDAATGERIVFRAPTNLMRTRFYVRVMNLYEGVLGGGDVRDLLPMLLLSRSGAGGTGIDPLLAALMLKSDEPGDDSNEALVRALILSGASPAAASGGGSGTLGLLLALQGSDLFGSEGTRRGRPRKHRPSAPESSEDNS